MIHLLFRFGGLALQAFAVFLMISTSAANEISPQTTEYLTSNHEIQPSMESDPFVIKTTFSGKRANRPGHMIDISSAGDKPMRIVAMDVHIASNASDVPIDIYAKEGTHNGHQTVSTSWTHIGSTIVKAMGLGNPTHVPKGSFSPLTIHPRQVYGLYITTSRTNEWREYPMITGSVKQDQFDNGDLIIYGAGSSNKFFRIFSTSRQWNGALYYEFL